MHETKNASDVTPWLDHGIQKNNLIILIILLLVTGPRGQDTG
ncbi:hypothetical protein [Rickettsia endosymbiont of Ixodes pacificus]|nr:hypothetical protein [Rickettsia endosymbiont of Ixodes pacificus]